MYACVSNTQVRTLPGQNLNAFGYVHIAPLTYSDGSVDFYGIWARVSSMFRNEGLRILSESDLNNFPRSNLGQVLYCTINHFYSSSAGGLGGKYATVIIECRDVLNREIYYGKGKFQGIFTESDDLDAVLKLAFQGFAVCYIGFNQALLVDINKEIEHHFAKSEIVDLGEEQLKLYYDNNFKDLNQIEGIWSEVENKQNKIGIFNDKVSTNRDYVAIIVESHTPFWSPKQVKIEFEKTAYSNTYSTVYYMHDHLRQGTTSTITQEGLLEINLKNPDGTTFKSYFVKNYPINVRGESNKENEISPGTSIFTGSGFLIDQIGFVVTNFHIVKEKDNIEVVFPQINESFKATIALSDKNYDLAILRLSDFDYFKVYSTDIPYSISESVSVNLGQSVFTLGFPLGEILGKFPKFSTGEISSLYGIQDDPRVYQISNPIQPGNSGSPLFNNKGALIGVVVASINAKYLFEKIDIIPQNINFAIKSDYLLNIISMLPEGNRIISRSSKLSKATIEDQVKLLTPFILHVKAK